MNKLKGFVFALFTVVTFYCCVNDKISMNYFWQNGKIDLPENYEILTEKRNRDSTIVSLKLNKQQVNEIICDIELKDNYLESMYIVNPELEISDLFKGANWGRYEHGYFFQSSRIGIIDKWVLLDTSLFVFTFKEVHSF